VEMGGYRVKQAGTELCQAQSHVSFLAEAKVNLKAEFQICVYIYISLYFADFQLLDVVLQGGCYSRNSSSREVVFHLSINFPNCLSSITVDLKLLKIKLCSFTAV
jgi:hypothetical protein